MIKWPIVCPFCGYHGTHVDGVYSVKGSLIPDHEDPQPGNISLCIGCGEFSIFFGLHYVRRPTAEEAAEFATDPDLIEVKKAWQQIVDKHGRPTGGYGRGGRA